MLLYFAARPVVSHIHRRFLSFVVFPGVRPLSLWFSTVPHLIHILSVYGFKYTICAKPTMWYGSGAVGCWTQLFVFSKVGALH